jgi:predicted AAA+ superfamily ATPase
MIQRLIAERLSSSRKSVLLLGARQVGKSTLVRALRPDMFVDLADEGAFLGFAKDPTRLGREVRALRRPSLIALDEVQRVPSLLNTVQG